MKKTVENRIKFITELLPYLDDRPLTEELLVELGFEKHITDDLDDGSEFVYYTWSYKYSLNVPLLIADNDNDKWEVLISGCEHIGESPYWDTYGTVKMLMICLQGDKPKEEE